MEVGSGSGRDALDRAPAAGVLAPLVEVPVAVNLRRPDRVQNTRAVVGGSGSEYVACFRDLECVGREPCRAVEFPDQDTIAILPEFLPCHRQPARWTGSQRGEISLSIDSR